MEIKSFICILFSGVSMVMDIKTEKVSNIWILLGSIVSMIVNICFLDNTSVWDWLKGMFFPLIILFPLFIGKMLGTGDIKVFMVLGSMIGWTKIFQCILMSFILGAIVSLPLLLMKCNVYERFSYFISYVISVMQTRTIQPYLVPGKRPENIHFTIPIFCSVMLMLIGGGEL